jgi:hypothetical protein
MSRRRRVLVVVAIAAVSAVLVILGRYLASNRQSLGYILSTGALASLIASAVWGLLTVLALREPSADGSELRQALDELRSRELQNVDSIAPKYQYRPDFWRHLLEESKEARSGLFACGHALDTWSEEDYRNAFIDCMVFLARHKCDVRLLLLDPAADKRIPWLVTLGANHRDRVQRTLKTVAEAKNLAGKASTHIRVKFLSADIPMPYMLFGTGRKVVVSPYLARTSSRAALCVSFEQASALARGYLLDFEALYEEFGNELPATEALAALALEKSA